MRVLTLVDGDPFYPWVLREAGWTVIKANSVEEAQQVVEPYDVILADSQCHVLPAELARLFPAVPLVYMSTSQWILDKYGEPVTAYTTLSTDSREVLRVLRVAVEES